MRYGVYPSAARIFEAADAEELPSLVSGDDTRRVASLCDSIPFPVESCGYEVRLGGPQRRPDFAFCLLRKQNPVLGPGRWKCPADPGLAGEGRRVLWERATAFLEAWARPGWGSSVPFTWFAFDDGGASESLPPPCLSLCLEPGFFSRRLGLRGGIPLSAGELVEVLKPPFLELLGYPMPPDLGEILAACHRALPEGGAIMHASFMTPRSPPLFKLNVELPPGQAICYLRSLGWSGSLEAAGEMVEVYAESAGRVRLNLILHPRFSPGLELELLAEGGPGYAEARAAFLRKAVLRGLCTPERGQALLQLAVRPLLERSAASPFSISRSWYAKIKQDADGAFIAKAYLGYTPRVFALPETPVSGFTGLAGQASPV